MHNGGNPFEYDAAPNLKPDLLVDWFIEDHNFSRFIRSNRNVLINGERGSGKSMALIYNSVRYQKLREQKKGERFPPDYAGIYVPCNTPLIHKQEYKLLGEVEQAILSEHYLAYSIGSAIAKEFQNISEDFTDEDNKQLIDEFSYLTGACASGEKGPFKLLQRAIREKILKDQQVLARGATVELSFDTASFYTLIFPILEALKNTSLLQNTHLSLLIDDAHDLNMHQRKILNSWLGYRDHSIFSFKVAIAGLRNYDMRTASGGTILEGHDYITVDLEQSYQNKESEFGKFAREVVERRLQNVGLPCKPEEFFPESEPFNRALAECNQRAREEAIAMGYDPNDPNDAKAIRDYVYKYGRAIYFRERSPKANRPIYAGFDTLVHLSTGVIRNLLDPCFRMYDELCSESSDTMLYSVPCEIQSRIIQKRSERLWEFIRNNLETQVEGCGKTEADKLRNLFMRLAEYFRHRLKHHKSEPRILTFIISQRTPETDSELDPILRLAHKAQLLYIRSGRSKDGGGKEDYFTPNRMLWPEYGLDVHGQHGRASLKAVDLVGALHGNSLIKENSAEPDHPDLFL
jgi:hypothetical protein